MEIRPGLTARFDLSPDQHGRPVLTSLTLEGDVITADDLRRISVRKLEAQGVAIPERPAKPLTRPAASGPDAHPRLVAEHYLWRAAQVSNPAKAMAEDAGVPVATVHSWIREARLLGLLPFTGRGKTPK